MPDPRLVSTQQLQRAMRWMTAGWIGILLVSLAWNIWAGWTSTVNVGRAEARIGIEKDLVYRRWASMHGGVYVPPTEMTPPNPYLRDIADRDVVTTSGQKLTLVNPAYMTRQVHELAAATFGQVSHITSLRPIRPENAPDEWEAAALRAFDAGAKEVSDSVAIGGVPYLRLMRPMYVEQACMKCHARQGYHVGEVRGGLSAAVPLAPLVAATRRHIITDVLGHCLLGGVGLFALGFARRRLTATLAAEQQASAALAAREEMFRSLVAGAGDGFECIDETGRIVEVNEESCRQLGYSREELLQLKLTAVDPNIDIDHFSAAVQGLVSGAAILIETVHRRKDGTLFPVEIKASVVRTHAGLRVLALVRDVTDRKRAQAALAASERQFRTIVETTNEGIWTVDREFRTVFVNRRLTEMLGYSEAEMAGQTPETYMFAEDLLDHKQHAAARRAGQTGQYERRYRRKDGGTVWTLSSVTPIQNERGDFDGVIAILADITERREAEESMRQLTQRLVLHVEHTPHAVIEFDVSGHVRAWNPAASTIFGYAREEAVGQSWEFLVPELARANLTGVWAQLMEQHGGRRSTNQNRTKDGRLIFCEWFNTTLIDADGRTIGVASLVMDVTERRHAEEALRARNEQLTRFNRAATDRELRMIELKHEVNELCRQCGEPPRYGPPTPPDSAEKRS